MTKIGDNGKGIGSDSGHDKSFIPPSSPIFLHPSDSPSLKLTQTVFNGENYDLWADAVRNGLDAKNKLGFVDGTVTKPAGTEDDSYEVVAWPKYSSVPDCTCGARAAFIKEKKEEKVHQFIMGLNTSLYDHLRSNLLMDGTLTSLSRAYALVLREERHKAVTRIIEEQTEVAMTAKTGRSRGRGSTVTNDQKEYEPPNCSYCNKWYHTEESCWDKLGINGRGRGKGRCGGRGAGRGGRGAGSTNQVANATTTSEAAESSKKDLTGDEIDQLRSLLHAKAKGNEKLTGTNRDQLSEWMLDSGASHHMTGCRALLSNIWKGDPSTVGLPNDSTIMDQSMKTEIGRGEQRERVYYMTRVVEVAARTFGRQVKIVQSDNGTEFLSGSLKQFYNDNGMIFQTSMIDTPQQNGRVERKHRHILEKARALRFQANLPIDFWGECVLTAAYLINRTPTKLLNGRTPYELLYGHQPNFDNLRVFGCLAYAHNKQRPKDKFNERGTRCLFIGYPKHKKGWRLYNLKTRKFFESRDVIFYEHVFPYNELGNPSDMKHDNQPNAEENVDLLAGPYEEMKLHTTERVVHEEPADSGDNLVEGESTNVEGESEITENEIDAAAEVENVNEVEEPKLGKGE
ncbi:uncharacterized protein LOC141649926 [Silene latifolia]|uniref:uncharacterized protein LOC141649926 n=1 Tax=Silene latifolia TaxID=37657 RepID=UPI003D7821A9